jgi:hypothetical protein
VRVLKLPWAEPSSRFTALFEALAIAWLKAASQKAVGEQLGLSWDEIHGIMERAVKRGLARRQAEPIHRLGVDEKAFRKGHKYFTLVNDLERSRVLYVAEDRKQESLDGFWETLTEAQREGIEAVAMDMWDPYVASVREHVAEADQKIVFDKFHVAQHLSQAPVRSRVPRRLNRDRRGACQAPRSRSQYRPATKFFGTWRPLSLACGPAGVARCGNSRAAFAPRAQIDPQAGAVVWRWLSSGPRHPRSHSPHRISRALFENITSKLAVRRSHAHPVVTLGVGEQYRRHHTSCNHPLLNPIPLPQDAGEFGTPRGGQAQAQYLVVSPRHVEICNKLAPNPTANPPSD